ncbi:MAG: polysaccharide deacetylase family protein [Gemmatimonadales bacterium]
MNRQERLVARCFGIGPISALAARFARRGTFVALNYHRIGRADLAPNDPGVFTVTAEEFDAQMLFLREHAAVIGLAEVLDSWTTGRPLPRNAVVITFDDGYLDNYEVAFPILKRYELPAVFFLVTDMIGTATPPWWDVIARLLKTARRRDFEIVSAGRVHRFDLRTDPVVNVIQRVLGLAKTDPRSEADFAGVVEAACEGDRPDPLGRLFLDWSEAREMLAGGMAIGSHSVTHRLMAKLDPASQRAEAADSRRLLEERLGVSVDAFAYPVGRQTSFSPASIDAVREAGYSLAFTFCRGVNRVRGLPTLLDLRRLDPGDAAGLPMFRGRLAMAGVLGR